MHVEVHSSEVFNSEGTTKEQPPSEADPVNNNGLEDARSKTDGESLETKSIEELKLLTNLLSNSLKEGQNSSKMRSIFSFSKSVPVRVNPILARHANQLPVRDQRTFWQRFCSYCRTLACFRPIRRRLRRRRRRRLLQLLNNMHNIQPIAPLPPDPINRRPVLYQIRNRIQDVWDRVSSRNVRIAPEIPDQNITEPISCNSRLENPQQDTNGNFSLLHNSLRHRTQLLETSNDYKSISLKRTS
jgi:hypothetical protein